MKRCFDDYLIKKLRYLCWFFVLKAVSLFTLEEHKSLVYLLQNRIYDQYDDKKFRTATNYAFTATLTAWWAGGTKHPAVLAKTVAPRTLKSTTIEPFF